MPAMAYTQDDVDALEVAIKSGERQVSIGGQSVTYQTIDSLIKARNDAVNELARARRRANPQTKQTYIHYGGRGYDT